MSFVFEPVCADFRKVDDEIPGGVDPFLSERLPWEAVHGNLERVQECMVGGANIDERSRGQRTALMEAACYGRLPVVEYLLAQDPKYNAKDHEGKTALIHAAENGHRGVCEALVNSKCIDLNMQDAKRWTPLMWAAYNGHQEVVQFLVHAGADSGVHDASGRNALQLAADGGNDASTRGRDRYEIQSRADSTVAVQRILQGERARRVREVTLEAARKGFANVIDKAVASGATEEDVSLALLAASAGGHVGIVSQLLHARANINFQIAPQARPSDGDGPGSEGQQSGSALLLAAANAHSAVVSLLIKHRADINLLADDGGTLAPDRGISPLYVAAKNGSIEVVQACIDADADLEVRNWDGTTPLIIATKEGHAEVVAGLLQVGANVFAKDMFGRTAGDIALAAVQQKESAESAMACAKLLLPAKTQPPLTHGVELVPRPPAGPYAARSGDGGGPTMASLERMFNSVKKDIMDSGSQIRRDASAAKPKASPAPSQVTGFPVA